MKRTPDFNKAGGLVPAIVQDASSGQVLMLGYMNEEAYQLTCEKGRVHFFSRSRNKLWEKGETSGNFLEVQSVCCDCDSDTVLVLAKALGPCCHEGTTSCFEQHFSSPLSFLSALEKTIADRQQTPSLKSYTSSLFTKGLDAIAQKVGEEAVEVIIAAKNESRVDLLNETADLVYHLLVLLKARGLGLAEVSEVLKARKR